MKQKKTMELWQMIVSLILSVLILATMFLPAYHITSDALDKGMEKAQIEEDEDKEDKDAGDEGGKKEEKEKKKKGDAAKDKDSGEDKKNKQDKSDKDGYLRSFENKIETEKKENGTDNENISILRLMTKSLADIRYNGGYDGEHTKNDMDRVGHGTYDALNKKHTMAKILLWVVYGLVLVVVLVTLLGYCLKWIKYIPLTINVVYGIYASIAFALLRSATMSGVKEEVGKLTEDFIGSKFADINVDVNEVALGFVSYAFLLGLVAAAIFLAVSVISMFIGGQSAEGYEDGSASMDGWDDPAPMDGWDDPGPQKADPGPVPSGSAAPALDVDAFPSQGAGGAVYSGDTQGIAPFDPAPSADMGIQRPDAIPNTVASDIPPVVLEPPKKPAVPSGKVCCTKGMTAGTSGYSLTPDRKVIVGKSPQQANLVIVNNARISNIHCTIRYEPATNSYIVKDHSTNGTYVNGAKMQKEIAMTYPSGTVLKLADGSVEITLG